MKKYKSIGKLLAVSFLTATIASACTEDAMDKINENPNNPLDAPAKFLITDLGVSTAFSTVGGDIQPALPRGSTQRRAHNGYYLQQCMDQRVLKYQEC